MSAVDVAFEAELRNRIEVLERQNAELAKRVAELEQNAETDRQTVQALLALRYQSATEHNPGWRVPHKGPIG